MYYYLHQISVDLLFLPRPSHIVLTLWKADCYNQADCHGQINVVKKIKNLIFFKNVLKGHRMKG